MDIHSFFQEQINKSKQYIKLQDQGLSQMEATYKVFGVEIGDEMLKLKQSEIILKPTTNEN